MSTRSLFFSAHQVNEVSGKGATDYPFEILMIMLDPDVISQPIENICVMSGADSKVFRENIVTDSPLKRFFEIHASRPSLRCIQIPLFASHIALPLPYFASHCLTFPHIALALLHFASHCLALPHIATHCLALPHIASHCFALPVGHFLKACPDGQGGRAHGPPW